MEKMKQSLRFQLPLEPGASEALEAWKTIHKDKFFRLVWWFARLHSAIMAQEAGEGLEELKRDLLIWDDQMSDWYLSLSEDVDKLAAGYGGPTVLSRFYAAIESAGVHQENYRKLRVSFDAFLSS